MVDADAVATLTGSLRAVGQLYSVIRCKQHPGVILAGAHRLEAAKRLGLTPKVFDMDVDLRAKELGHSHAVTEQLITIHSNTQRQPGRDERKAEFNELARRVYSDGGLERERVAETVVAYLGHDWSRSWVLELLDDEWKNPRKAEAGKKGGSAATVAPPGGAKDERSDADTGRPEDPPARAAKRSLRGREPYAKGTSPRLSDSRRATYTAPAVALASALESAGVDLRMEEPFRREGEVTADGKPKSYYADVLLLKRKVILEAEGEGSSSADNEDRDRFFREKGFAVVHLSNKHIVDHAFELVDLIKALL